MPMGVIKATAYPNALTKLVSDDYYLLLQILGTLNLHDIVERLRKREIATKNVDGETFTQNVFDEMAAASAEGYNVVTSYFRSSLSAQTVVFGADLGHPLSAERVNLRVNFNQGEGAKKAIAGTTIFVNEQTAASGPVIQSATDPTENKSNTLNVGGMVLLQGMRLSLKGDDASVGITFVKAEESGGDRPEIESVDATAAVGDEVFIRPSEVYPNTPSNLQFILPAQVTAGNWNVKITTQGTGSSNITTKEPRTYQYEKVVTVKTSKL